MKLLVSETRDNSDMIDSAAAEADAIALYKVEFFFAFDK
jgi:hypothetical protein